MTQIIIKKYSVAEIMQAVNFKELLEEYGKESSIKGMPPPLAKMETYAQLEKTGKFHILASFDSNILLGFITVLLYNLPHYDGANTAISESFFVPKKYRATGLGTKLRRAVEQFSKECGTGGILISTPYGGVLEEVLFGTDGYTPTNTVFFKKFKDE